MRIRPLLVCLSSLLLPVPALADASLGTPDPATIEYPDGAPHAAAEVLLGKTLFFDTRLSQNRTQSCATCHNPELGFGDGMSLGLGAEGKRVGRNTPHLYNLAWNPVFFWDGRAASLEEQALGPIQAAGEMNMPIGLLIDRLQVVPWYREQVKAIYGSDKVTPEHVGKAIAAFERTLVSNNSPFDRYQAGDRNAMSPSAVRGLALFQGKAGCTKCHDGPNFTDSSFHNVGVKGADAGRAKIVNEASLHGAFKTPGLRNTALTAPYMHDGSEPSLEAVVRFYNRGGDEKKNRDPLIRELKLSAQDEADLVAFMGALTDPLRVDRPTIPADQ